MINEHVLASGMRVWTAHPDGAPPRPAVILLHERYGPVRHTWNLLERLARDGYVGCVPDLFHRFTGDRSPIERGEDRIDPRDDESIADIDETLAFLRTQNYVDAGNIGMVGFCLSGRTPLVFASARDGLKAIAVFQGGVYPRDYEPIYPGQGNVADYIPRIGCPLLGVFGEADNLVPLSNVFRMRAQLEEARRSYWMRIIPGAQHAWIDSTMPTYDPNAAEDSWQTLLAFYRQCFSGEWEGPGITWRFEAGLSAGFDTAAFQR